MFTKILNILIYFVQVSFGRKSITSWTGVREAVYSPDIPGRSGGREKSGLSGKPDE